MIVPFKNSKSYGVLHTENYFSFLGFSKKVNSDEIQKIDIYLDDKLFDTITADKHIEKIEDIYELEGFGFTYILPNEYVGQKSSISFKNHDTKEHLQNSPYELIQESHPKFNEMAFLNSLNNPINEDKIKDLYCPNTIGFLATEKNLKDEEFVSYIKELILSFPDIDFKGFYFNKIEKNKIESIFKNYTNKVNLIIPNHLSDLTNNIEFYIHNSELDKSLLIFRKVYEILIYKCPNIFSFQFIQNRKGKTIKEENLLYDNHPFIKDPNFFGLDKSFEYDLYTTIYKTILEEIKENAIDLNINLGEFEHFTKLSYAIKNKRFKEFYFNLNKFYKLYLENKCK